jgi:hypothetical protein
LDCGICRLSQALISAFKEAQQNSQSYLEWDMESKKAFQTLKQALQSPPALSLPTQDGFQLYVYEKGGLALGVLTQLRGPTPQSVGYLSKEIDNVAKGWSGCLRALAAICPLIPEAQKLILGWPLTIYTLHDLGGLLTSKGGQWLSDNRLLKYQGQLLKCPDISLRVCSALNLASLLPTEEGPITHSHEEVLAECYSARPDLLDQPLPDPDLTLFMDGSSSV